MDLIERARRYVAKMESPRRAKNDSQDSHAVVFGAACALVKGFNLPRDAARALLVEFCQRSDEPWTDREIDHKIRQAENSGGETGHLLKPGESSKGVQYRDRADQAKAAAPLKKSQPLRLDEVKVRQVRGGSFAATEKFLADRSPVDLSTVTRPEEFLGHLFRPGEKVLVFTRESSQGDFGFEVRGGERWPGRSFRLGDRPEVKAEAAPLPRSGRQGVWFLASPVDGEWKPNGGFDKWSRPMLSRRSAPNVTAWRYMLLESDELEWDAWLGVLLQLPLPIAALYTSGSRSIHALLRLEAKTQDHMRQLTQQIGPFLSALGGDAGAMSSVRLTRLPLCEREGKMVEGEDGKKIYRKFERPAMQRLLWLDPWAEPQAILTKPKARETTA